MKMNWKHAAATALVCAAGIGFCMFGTSFASAEETQNLTIADNVYISDVNVGGMTQSQAELAVESYVDSKLDAAISLKAGDRFVYVTARELGVSWENTQIVDEAERIGQSGNLIARYKAVKDLAYEPHVFPIRYTLDEEKAAALIESHMEELEVPAVDYGLEYNDGSFTITDGQEGVTVSIAESLETIEEFLNDGWQDGGQSVELVCETLEPRGTKEELSKVKDLLGEFSTDYSSSASGRKANVSNGASKVNGTVLYPGDEFNMYETVSPFTIENGYGIGGAYQNGTVVDSIGGGICQVSTTLYEAALRAELEITERYPHSMIVTYVKHSMDAAISGTSKNLRFVNNTDAPIYIMGYANGSTVGFKIYGQEYRDPNRSISFESETISTTEPKTTYKAVNKAIGYYSKTQSGHTGAVAKLWKIVTVNGVQTDKILVNTSTYSVGNEIIEVGISSSSSEAVAAMKSAIASGNSSTIHAAMSKWNDKALAAAKAEEEEAAAAEEEETAATDPSAAQTTTPSSTETTTPSSTTTNTTENKTDNKTENKTETNTGSSSEKNKSESNKNEQSSNKKEDSKADSKN
jgi:vancomycin resistance protein YoaR